MTRPLSLARIPQGMRPIQMLLFQPESSEAQEWAIAQSVVRDSAQEKPDEWAALAACPVIEVYTDGSAPVRNPGGPAGFAAILVGFYATMPKDAPERPTPAARLDLGGYVPARAQGTRTSNNRAEIGGLLLALGSLRHLMGIGWVGREATVWSDSRYAVLCATGVWKRKKNTDLWAALDGALLDVMKSLPKRGFTLLWVKGHAGNEYNEVADELATLAAFNFDKGAHARFRAAQTATGQEMPGASQTTDGEPLPNPQSTIRNPQSNGWLGGADYALAIQTHFQARDQKAGTGTGIGHYRLWSKSGQSREAEVRHEGQRLLDEFEYLTLIAALTDMVKRMIGKGRNPGEFALRVYSGRELVVKQLRGEYKVKAATLQEPYREAAALLKRFKWVEIEWKRGREMDEVIREGPV